MSQDKTQLFNLINTNLPDNTTKAITPQKLREVQTQVADSMLNTVEPTAQSVAGEVNFAGGLKSGGESVLTKIHEVEILRAYSTASDQSPSALSTPLQIEFGAEQTVSEGTLSDSGAFTCAVTGNYPIRIKLQVGRSGAAGVSLVFSRILINGVQVGVSAAVSMSSSEDVEVIESRVVVPLTAGDVFSVEIIRDSYGTNYGGLFAVASTEGWNLAPSALLVISKYEQVS